MSSTNCPNCGAPIDKSRRKCAYCRYTEAYERGREDAIEKIAHELTKHIYHESCPCECWIGTCHSEGCERHVAKWMRGLFDEDEE